MSEAKHTPGPWSVDGDEVWSDETQSSVCMILLGPGADANARLIASAPDLLEIARRVVDHFDDTDSVLKIDAQEAIAKAEGR